MVLVVKDKKISLYKTYFNTWKKIFVRNQYGFGKQHLIRIYGFATESLTIFGTFEMLFMHWFLPVYWIEKMWEKLKNLQLKTFLSCQSQLRSNLIIVNVQS